MLIPYGPPDAQGTRPELVETFGELELEYAAVRKSAAILDRPDRGVIEVTGAERIDFLNNMITQELKPAGTPLAAGAAVRSYWLNRKGRIDADMLIIELGDRMLIELDVHTAADTVASLDGFLFAEDCTLSDASESLHRFDLFGPGAAALLGTPDLTGNAATTVEIAGKSVTVARRDETGSPGFVLIVALADAEAVYDALVQAGAAKDPEAPPNTEEGRVLLRPVGWHAFNIARVEAGTPLFNIDFGPDNLPAESGALESRVSFTKGCYLGQEVVARMHSLGAPKQQLASLRFTNPDAQPSGGAPIYNAEDSDTQVGTITSSSISPLLGAEPVAFAMVKTKHASGGTSLWVYTDQGRIEATVQEDLAFVGA